MSLEECYAMRLMADVFMIELGDMPDEIASISLDAADAAGSGEHKKARAMALLFGERAEYLKKQTEKSTRAAVDKLVSKTLESQVNASDAMNVLMQRQRALTILLIALLLLVVALTSLLIIKPVREGVRHINEHRTLPLSGSREMVILANAYNDMFIRQEKDAQALNYSATHDALTGLYNRAAFDAIREGLDGTDAWVLLIDIDHFKDFNDSHGHAMGDRVIRRVSQVLTGNFRGDDFLARIGGDEFCGVLYHAGAQARERVAEKAARINAQLQQPEGDLPPVSVSIGIAFGNRPHPQGDVVRDADTALYQTKRSGRAGYCFFDSQGISPPAS